MLTAGIARRVFRYVPETGLLYWAEKCATKVVVGKRAGSDGAYGYRVVRFDGVPYKEHRLIWLICHGEWPSAEIDHINGDRADNRIANLREATPGQNKQNLTKRSDNTSGYTGVSWETRCLKWQAIIHVGGKQIYLGCFDTKEAAAEAYAKAKAELHTFNPVARAA